MKQVHIFELSLDDLQKWFINNGYEKFRAKQILGFALKQKKHDFKDFHNIPKPIVQHLLNDFNLRTFKNVRQLISQNKETEKYLITLHDDTNIEAVILKHQNRITACLSSQVGCALGCVFCATAKMGFKRNLTTGEIIEQLLTLSEHHDINNIVFMGMGEPLKNYENVVKAINLLTSKDGLNISQKRFTISTAGIVKKIKALAKDLPKVSLSVSLNAPTNELRSKLMPVNKSNPLHQKLLPALIYYQQKTNNRFTFEYVMIKDLNIKKKDAAQIIKLRKSMDFYLNIIPYNVLPFYPYNSPEPNDIKAFSEYFKDKNISVIKRYSKGDDIYAGCGQLACINNASGRYNKG
jgi:23S rRNA (adenine2503-C2)-methyltransferase